MTTGIAVEDARANEPYALPVSGSLDWARWATAVAGVVAGVAAIIGLRFGEQGLYQSDDLVFAQLRAQDLITLIVTLPLLGAGVWRAGRGSARGLIVWAGALVYLAYWYQFLLDGLEFGPMYLLHLSLVASSLFALVALGTRCDVERLAHRFGAHMPARAIGGFIAIIGGVFATAGIIDIVGRVQDREVLDAATRGVYSVDFTIMLPATVTVGVLLWRRRTWGFVAAGPLLVNAVLSGSTLLATLLLLGRDGAPLWGAEAVVGTGTLLVLAVLCRYLREVRV